MQTKHIDVALTLKVTIPTNLATEYRQLAFQRANVELAKLSSSIPDDAEFVERILRDNIRAGVGKILPQYLEGGGFGVRVVPLALQRSNIQDTGEAKAPAEAEVAEAV